MVLDRTHSGPHSHVHLFSTVVPLSEQALLHRAAPISRLFIVRMVPLRDAPRHMGAGYLFLSNGSALASV